MSNYKCVPTNAFRSSSNNSLHPSIGVKRDFEKYNSVINIKSNQELLLPFLEKFCPYLQEDIKKHKLTVKQLADTAILCILLKT